LQTIYQQYQALCESYTGGSDFSIAINICANQLNQVGFVEQTLATLEQFQLPPQVLVLEITESALLNNSPDARNKVESIKQQGIRVSIDDYGSGCSSLTCLKELAFDEIKLDCALVHKISESASDRELVCAIIGMSQSLNMTLVAEGVETQEQYDFLQAHNCQVYQGLHFQEPLPLAKLDS
jgi:EAL domain-containing protein (putative c-di-GMP-specific phosphodiesterase class I)